MSSEAASIPPPSLQTAPDDPPGPGRGALDDPGWRPVTSLFALLAGFGGAIFGAIVVGLVAGLLGASLTDPPPAVSIIGTVVQDVCLVASALFFARLAARPRPSHFGLRAARTWPAVGWAALAYAGFYGFTAAWVALLGTKPADENLPKELGADKSTLALVSVAVLVSVVAPMAEEFFFRGYFYGALRNWNVWGAALVTGLVFGAIHAGSAQSEFLLPLAFFGVVLCWLRERTGSLYPGIVLHCANNSIAFGVSQHWGWEIGALFLGSVSVFWVVARLVRTRWDAAAAVPVA
ncbi:MAG: CPBP family intramembrane metalloprotease [Actinomycetota bacterium]|nr:CPBP family intramembrane metalloprotease [Actinomycetota bacterium]